MKILADTDTNKGRKTNADADTDANTAYQYGTSVLVLWHIAIG